MQNKILFLESLGHETHFDRYLKISYFFLTNNTKTQRNINTRTIN